MKNRKHLFARRRPARWLFIVTATLAALGACAPDTAEWSPVESPKKNSVDWVAFHHAVRFSPKQTQLDELAKANLSRFIRRLGTGEGVRVMVSAASNVDGALIAGRREAAVSAYLRTLGVRPRLAAAERGRSRDRSIVVTVGRYVVTTPKCPDWSKPSHKDFDNRQSSNLGCASETNLGLMIANPKDLVRGRTLGPADGEAVSRAIDNYRQGKVEELESEGTTGDSKSGGSKKQ